MAQSLSYHLTLFILKLKGLKREFSKDPIDYKKIRKEDVLQPKGKFFAQNTIRKFTVSDSSITEIGRDENFNKLLIFIHGGAFISGPGKHHWDSIKEIATKTEHKIWMCIYPKAPESKISAISENIDEIYAEALKDFEPNQISLIGDSAGGTLVTALIQRLIEKKMKTPNKIILVSPVMDASMTNQKIDKLDKIDPVLSKAGVFSAKKMCAENNDLNDPRISPLNGSFDQFPKTIIYLPENDITYPDQKLAVEKLLAAKVNLEIIEGKNMPHIWPFLPVMKEAKVSLTEIIEKLNN